MAKNAGIEIFELFRNSTAKPSATATVEPEKAPVTRIAPKAPAPVATPPPAAPAPSKIAGPSTGDTVISMKLNTALFGLMVGAACLFGSFALGVKWERRQHGGDEAAAAGKTETGGTEAVAAGPGAEPPRSSTPAATPRRDPRELLPPPRDTQPKPPADAPVKPAEPRKGWSLQLIAYPEADQKLASIMCDKVRNAGGSDAQVVKVGATHVVMAGFVEKQSDADAETLLRRYRDIQNRLGKQFNLNWIPQTR